MEGNNNTNNHKTRSSNMTVADRIKQLEARYNCEIADYGYAWTAWLVKEGEVWHESGAACLTQRYKAYTQTWKVDAIKELEDRASGGVYSA